MLQLCTKITSTYSHSWHFGSLLYWFFYTLLEKVGKIIENPDGSAILQIEMDQEALKIMAEYGVYQSILNSVSEMKDTLDDKTHYGTKR